MHAWPSQERLPLSRVHPIVTIPHHLSHRIWMPLQRFRCPDRATNRWQETGTSLTSSLQEDQDGLGWCVAGLRLRGPLTTLGSFALGVLALASRVRNATFTVANYWMRNAMLLLQSVIQWLMFGLPVNASRLLKRSWKQVSADTPPPFVGLVDGIFGGTRVHGSKPHSCIRPNLALVKIQQFFLV